MGKWEAVPNSMQNLSSPISALLFDMDGVLVHSTPLHCRSWEIYLTRHGIDPVGIEGRMLGLHNEELVGNLFGEHLSRDERRQHGKAKETLYRQLMAPVLEQYLVPGVREFLELHKHLPAAVVSNAESENIDMVLDVAGLRRYFPVVVDGGQVERPKPFPDIYLRAAALLGVQPVQCLVFEDSVAGITAGNAAQMQVVGLRTSLTQLPPVDLAIDDFHAPGLQEWLVARYQSATC